MSRILLIYSSIDGHTLKICHQLRQHLEAMGHSLTLRTVDAAASSELEHFDKIVIGASIRYGRHRPSVRDFVRTHAALLARKPSAFFSVNIVARKPEKSRPESNPYMRCFLRQLPWQPRLLGVFAGKLNYPAYGYFDRQMIRFIMLLTHGPTDPSTVLEFTDWQQVQAFAQQLDALA